MRALQPYLAAKGPRIELVPQMVPDRGGMRTTSAMRVVDSRGRVFLIPAGFLTNFESIPALARALVGWLLGDLFTTALAAVPHDFLYRSQEIPRAEADLLFWELLTLLDPPRDAEGKPYKDEDGREIDRSWRGPAANWLKWSTLRVLGWTHWKKRTLEADLPSRGGLS